MNKIKMIAQYKMLMAIAVLLLAGCKYEDGPAISLRSKKARAANTWQIDKAFENGVDRTNEYKNTFVNYQMVMNKDLSYTLSYRPFNISNLEEKGAWDFSDKKNAITFIPTGKSSGGEWRILRLKEHEAWVLQTIDGKEVELRMKD